MNPTCHRCIHYFITWQVSFPHGCRAMGFKSRRLPMVEVRRAMQGKNCLAFKLKSKRKSPAMPKCTWTAVDKAVLD